MNHLVYRKTTDAGDKLVVALVNKSNRKRVDLTDCTAALTVVQVLNSGELSPVLVSAAVAVEEEGLLTYTWQEGDLSAPGLYLCTFRVTFSDSVESFPKQGYIEIHAESSL